MICKKQIHNDYVKYVDVIEKNIDNFNIEGEVFGNQERNSLKLFKFKDKTLNVKSFKVPNLINKIAYKFIRKSKAQRSFEYANKLQLLQIGTPQPIAFYEFETAILFKNSFYISEHLEYDLTYRELTKDLNYPEHNEILRAFTQFTFKLHENGVNFLDHSPGNTLIIKEDDAYKFYLVDLNRMKFGKMDYNTRIKNFAKLTTHKSMIDVMSNEYAKLINKDPKEVFDLMWHYTQEFQERYWRRRRIKNKLKFWKT